MIKALPLRVRMHTTAAKRARARATPVRALSGVGLAALAAAFASDAPASGFEMKVGGHYEVQFGFVSADYDDLGLLHASKPDTNGVDVKRDAEIYFKPSITLENGVKIGATVELEGSSGEDAIDDSHIAIDGAFGRLVLGAEDSARTLMHYNAPSVSIFGVNDGDIGDYLRITGEYVDDDPSSADPGEVEKIYVGDGGGTLTATNGDIHIGGENADRITYFTPRVAGLQLGVSYARDAVEHSNLQADIEGKTDANIVDVGGNFVETFGGVDMAVSGGYGAAFGDGEENPQVFGAGLNLGLGGWTVGASFGRQDNYEDGGNGVSFDGGVSYETGPWAVSFTYFKGVNEDDEVFETIVDDGFIILNNGRNGDDESLAIFEGAAKYALAEGVGLHAFGVYSSFEEETGDYNGEGNDLGGFVVGAGMKMDF